MNEWLTKAFQQYSIIWLLLSSVIGGIVGASFKFFFESLLPQHLTQRREIIAAKRKYSTPILLAADQLRRRLHNMITYIKDIEKEDWLPSATLDGYYYLSTIYTVANFIGWQQILRHKIVYLDFTTTEETKTFEDFMRAIRSGFTDPSLLANSDATAPEESKDKWIFNFWLQGIGDSMIVKEDEGWYTMNYASFIKQMNESGNDDLKEWLHTLGRIFTDLKKKDIRFRRIVATHALVNAFVDYADPKHLTTQKESYYWNLLTDKEAQHIKKVIRSIHPKALSGD